MCNCIEKVNKLLEESGTNTALDIPVTFSFEAKNTLKANRVRVATKKRESQKRGQPKAVLATFCPFCGKEY